MDATIDIQGTATPVDGSSHPSVVTVQGPITTPELMVPFTGLHADTTYSFVFEALSRDIPSPCSGVPITDVFLRTDQQMFYGELPYTVWLPEIYYENAIKYVLFSPFVLVVQSDRGSSGIGALVGILIATILVSFLIGTLLVVFITCCCVRRRKSSGQLQPSYIRPEQLQPSYSQSEPLAVYSEVEIKHVDTFELKENVAYGPVRH